MNGGEIFVLCIVFAAIAGGIIKHYLRLKAVEPHADPSYQARVDQLERRVATLERIVTDKGYDLKGEFDRL